MLQYATDIPTAKAMRNQRVQKCSRTLNSHLFALDVTLRGRLASGAPQGLYTMRRALLITLDKLQRIGTRCDVCSKPPCRCRAKEVLKPFKKWVNPPANPFKRQKKPSFFWGAENKLYSSTGTEQGAGLPGQKKTESICFLCFFHRRFS